MHPLLLSSNIDLYIATVLSTPAATGTAVPAVPAVPPNVATTAAATGVTAAAAAASIVAAAATDPTPMLVEVAVAATTTADLRAQAMVVGRLIARRAWASMLLAPPTLV